MLVPRILCLALLAIPIAEATLNTTPNTFAVSLGQDRVSAGNWKGIYGQDGYLIVGEAIQLPPYATFDPHNTVNTYLLDLWSSDPRALQKAHPSYNPPERIAAYFHSLYTMEIDVGTTDNQPHRIAFYFADYERLGRQLVVDAVDTLTGALFDEQEVADLSDSFGQSNVYKNGLYIVYLYQGRVTFRIRNATEGDSPAAYRDAYGHGCTTRPDHQACAAGNPPTVAVSGIFWGGAAAPSTILPLTASLGFVAPGTYTGIMNLQAGASTQLQLLGDRFGGIGIGVRSLRFLVDGLPISPEIAAPDGVAGAVYRFAWDTTTVPGGPHVLTATARDGLGDLATSPPVAITIDNSPVAPAPIGAFAKLVGVDTGTAGNWKGVYGQDGNVIAQSSFQVPPYATFDSRGTANSLVRNLYSYDGRAPLKQFPSLIPYERIDSEFNNTLAMDYYIGAYDNQVHRLAVYCVDFDRSGKKIVVQALDVATGAPLAAAVLDEYRDGKYVVFRYRGAIRIRIANLNAPAGLATVSGFFWGGGGPY